jgi:hypothetical protein
MAAEWDRFTFEIGKGASNELTAVRHIAHVPAARGILEDKQIKAGLIYDDSRLNTSRINVAWVSANTWGPGSIYGTVEFQFAWAELVANQKIYWVEAMRYKPNAYRFLLTRRDIPRGLIVPYDPTKDEGPLRLKDSTYYWNGEFTSEFMIEEDLSLGRCIGLDFVSHHELYCRPFGTSCADRKHTPQRTGGRFLSFILAKELHLIDALIKPADGEPPFTPLDTAYDGLDRGLSTQVKFGGSIIEDASCQEIVRGALALYGLDQLDQAKKLLAHLAAKEHLTKALTSIIQTHFGDPNWTPTELSQAYF